MAIDSLFPDAPPSVSLARQVECARREVRQRERVYPRLVQDGRMSQAKADEEIEAMRAIVRALEDMNDG